MWALTSEITTLIFILIFVWKALNLHYRRNLHCATNSRIARLISQAQAHYLQFSFSTLMARRKVREYSESSFLLGNLSYRYLPSRFFSAIQSYFSRSAIVREQMNRLINDSNATGGLRKIWKGSGLS